MERQMPVAGEIYRHFKNHLYQIITCATNEADGTPCVVYQALYGDYGIYIRTLDNFLEPVDTVKYQGVEQTNRFEKVSKETLLQKDTIKEKTDTIQTSEVLSKESVANKQQILETEINESESDEINSIAIAAAQAGELSENTEESSENADERLLAFCDTNTFAEKYEILKGLRLEMTDRLVNDIAVVLDVVIPEGKLEDRYEALLKCLQTFCKYEVTRLR